MWIVSVLSPGLAMAANGSFAKYGCDGGGSGDGADGSVGQELLL